MRVSQCLSVSLSVSQCQCVSLCVSVFKGGLAKKEEKINLDTSHILLPRNVKTLENTKEATRDTAIDPKTECSPDCHPTPVVLSALFGPASRSPNALRTNTLSKRTKTMPQTTVMGRR